MSASLDWVRMETAISMLLPESAGTSKRSELLASLDAYAAAAIREARVLGPLGPDADECARSLSWLLRPVFICGHQRSGTTLLQNLLDGHPQLLTLPSEGTYLTSFAYVARKRLSSEALECFAAEWIVRLVDPNFAPHFRLGRSDARHKPAVDFARRIFGWDAALRRSVPPKFAALLALPAAFAATTAAEPAPLQWVEKTPQNERFARVLASLDGARFIQLVRDPRTTFASLKEAYRASGIAGFDAAEHAQAIGRSLRLAVDNRNLLQHRYLVVRYEDLVERTERVMERVRRFLQIPPSSSLLMPTANGSAVGANSSFGSGSVGVIEPPRRTALLSQEESAVVSAYAGAARVFDYALPAPAPAAQLALRVRHSTRHAVRFGRASLRAVKRALRRRPVDRSR